MRAWAIVAVVALWGCATSSQSGETSTPDSVFSDFKACDQADLSPGIDTLINRCSRALNSGLMPPDPTATALIRRGNLYSFKGDYDRSKQDYARVLAIKPMAAAIPENLAVVEFLDGDETAAFKRYDSVVARQQYGSGAYLARGIARRRIGDYDKAIEDFTKALTFRKTEARILVNRGFAYVANGSYELALADFDKAIQSEPDFLAQEIALVDARGGADDFNRAVPGYSYDIILKPDYFLLQRTRGFALYMMGRPEEALKAFDEYLSSQSQDITGRIMARLAAERVVTSMLDFDQQNAPEQPWPAPILQYLKGKASKADVLKAAGNTDPQRECSARFYFGENALGARHLDDARAEFQRAVAACPKGAFEAAAALHELARL